jgi:hypothetical protein
MFELLVAIVQLISVTFIVYLILSKFINNK